MAKKKIKSAAELRKKYNSAPASSMVVTEEDSLWLPSKILSVNDRFGGGILYGRILELFGDESSGKTLMAYHFAEACQDLGGHVLWVDAEAAYTAAWAEKLGLDNDRVELLQETAVEVISDWIHDMILLYRSQLINNEPILLVIDSLAALDTKANIDSDQEDAKAEMGNRAKAIYKMLRIRNQMMNDLGICTICVNQVRKKVGASMFEDPDTTPGGKAMAFYASLRVRIARGKQLKVTSGKYKGKRFGNESHIRVVKNKIAPPTDGIKGIPVHFNEKYSDEIGFSPFHLLPEMLQDAGVVTRKKGASRYFMKDKVVANGEEAFLKLLATDEKFQNKMIRKLGINTVKKTQKKLNKIEENLYPVE